MEGVRIYREKLTWPAWVHLALGAAVGLSTYGGVNLLRRSWQGWIAIGLALVLGYIWFRIRYLVLEISPDGIAFGFGKPGRRVPGGRIRSAEPTEYSFARYMGWGYRIGWKPRERAYSLIGYPRGLRVVFADDRDRIWDVYLSSRDPEAAAEALKP